MTPRRRRPLAPTIPTPTPTPTLLLLIALATITTFSLLITPATAAATITCAAGVQKVSLAYGACDDAPFPTSAVTVVGGTTTYTVDPPGPRYPPGSYAITVTPDNGSPACVVNLQVIPCKAVCTDKLVGTDPGVCEASTVSIIDPKSVGKTALASPQTTTQTPAGPYPRLATSPVSVVVNYPNGVVSAASDPACQVFVVDRERPTVDPIDVCVYPSGSRYTQRTYCFAASDLATIEDNCPDAVLKVRSCRLLGGGTAGGKHARLVGAACTVKKTNGETKLCVNLQGVGANAPRRIRAVIRGADSTNNILEVQSTIEIYATAGDNPECVVV